MSDDAYRSVYRSLKRSIIHTSTFSENSLAIRAGVATLDVPSKEHLGARATGAGQQLRQMLHDELSAYEMIKGVLGEGLLSGIEFQSPKSLKLKIAFEAFLHIHPAMVGQIVVMRLFRDHGILTQIRGNNFMVLKVAPPLVVTQEQMHEFVAAIHNVVDLAHNSAGCWSEALGLAKRAINL